jgi:hypothetical protein
VSRCRFRYEDLPPHLRAQVDAVLGKASAELPIPPAAKEKPATAGQRRRRKPNKTETAYRAEVLGRRADIADVRYEGLTFRMENGHRYTPDWVVVTGIGGIECHEVKGRHALHSQQRARLAFDQARVEFPWFTWIWAVRVKAGWDIVGVAT